MTTIHVLSHEHLTPDMTIKNDMLSSLGLMHIHRVFEVNGGLVQSNKVLVSAKTRRADIEQF